GIVRRPWRRRGAALYSRGMSSGGRRAIALAAILLIVLSSMAPAERARGGKKQEQKRASPPVAPADKRDRTVNAPGNPFHGKPYWQGAAQCGRVYFRLGPLASGGARRAE